jgi:hypothetical protein
MNDLVKRLRDGQCLDSIDTYKMIQQAAGRIEKLERNLKLILYVVHNDNMSQTSRDGEIVRLCNEGICR